MWFEKDSQPLFSFAFCESKESSCPSYSLDCGSFLLLFGGRPMALQVLTLHQNLNALQLISLVSFDSYHPF